MITLLPGFLLVIPSTCSALIAILWSLYPLPNHNDMLSFFQKPLHTMIPSSLHLNIFKASHVMVFLQLAPPNLTAACCGPFSTLLMSWGFSLLLFEDCDISPSCAISELVIVNSGRCSNPAIPQPLFGL